MTPGQPPAGRAIVGKVLLGSAALMLLVAALFWFRVVAVADEVRLAVAGTCMAVGVFEGLVALRFLGES
jgi:hypothetical protein